MQAVEPRLEQAAEAVERCRERATEEDRLGIRRIARLTLAGITYAWSFPPGGNVLNQPLDSSLRWNDDSSNGHIRGGMTGVTGVEVCKLILRQNGSALYLEHSRLHGCRRQSHVWNEGRDKSGKALFSAAEPAAR